MRETQKVTLPKRAAAIALQNESDVSDVATTSSIQNVPNGTEGHLMKTSFQASENENTAAPELVSKKASQELSPGNVSLELVAANVNSFADKFRGLRLTTSENIIEMGRIVREARLQFTVNEFDEFCAAIGFESQSSTVRKYELIGERADVLSIHSINLPNAWTSIYQLVQLAPVTLKKLLDDGTITSEITGKKIKEIVAKNSLQKSSVISKGKNCKKYQYQYGEMFDAPLDNVIQRELDVLVRDFISKKKTETLIQSQLEGGN